MNKVLFFFEKKMKEIFAVFAKKPLEGFAKTRLADSIGKKQATMLYSAFMKDFFYRLKRVWRNPIWVFYTPSDESSLHYFENFFLKSNLSVRFIPQKELPFFHRLKWLFDCIAQEESNAFIHLTGTDIPDFPFDFLKKAKSQNVFLGPDVDEGYYYVGAHCSYSTIFDGKGDTPLKTILRQCRKLNIKVNLLPEWSDIDTLPDLKKTLKRSDSRIIPETHRQFLKTNL